jgi:hypothetical protein
MFLAFTVKLIPAFIVKDQLNTLADQILRKAEVQGKINIDCSKYQEDNIIPDSIKFEASTFENDKVQIGEDIVVICTAKVDIGLFGDFVSFPITLKGKATGSSEVFWK